jgi:serine/threonine protein kinase/type II secretory pathway predicted ATPase ExeA
MLDRLGQQIGNYRLLRVLGQGSFAQVYLGEHCYLKSTAALKVLWHSLSEQEAQHFLEEARTLTRLRHAHIVRVLDFTIESGTPVLIMDYLSGGTLRQRHPEGTRLSISVVIDYITQLASALQYAHNRHVIHRDVKPENILLDDEQQLQLSDFGLALLTTSIGEPSTQTLAGTPSYLAPEQVRGKPCLASDQYALGVLTYEWLTGTRPFKGGTWELIQQHLTQAPPPLHERWPGVPTAIEQVVLRALSKDPHARYASISAFAQALERANQAYRQDRQADEQPSDVTAPLKVLSRVSVATPAPAHTQIQASRVVFLSVAPGDEHLANGLATDLSQRGITFSNSKVETNADPDSMLRAAMSMAQQVVVIGTPKTRFSRRIKEHLRLAQMYQRRLVIIWIQGEEMAALLLDQAWHPFLPIDVVDARGSRYQAALDELLVCLREGTYVSPYGDTTLSTAPEPRNPYKGLHAFRQEDATDFFGRDALIQETGRQLVRMLTTSQRNAGGKRLLTVVGPSGSGKSSVVQAGLLPRLQAGALPGSEHWIYLEPLVPGTHPLETLAVTLATQFRGQPVRTIQERLQDDSARGLHLIATQLVKRPHSRVVLVVDQFEELFSQTVFEEERRIFVDLLLTAVTETAGPVLVLLTVRADFYDRLMRYPDLYQSMQEHLVAVLPMELQELRDIIEKPAELPGVQLTFEGNLVGDLLFETQGQAGVLPLLEFTLDQLFQQRQGRNLTLSAYQEMGGVKGALVTHAEAIYAKLTSEEYRHLAQALFLRLVDPGFSEQDITRRRAVLTELVLSNARQTKQLQEVADFFVAARLLTTSEVAGNRTIEVSHEALLREWPRLINWMRGRREDLQLQQVISHDVSEWEQRGKSKDRLYRGSQLKEARKWAQRNMPSHDEVNFIRAGDAAQTRARASLSALILLLVFAAGLVAYVIQSSQPIDITRVMNLHDAGPGSLRQAITMADERSVITFDPSLQGGTIQLTSGNLNIGKSLMIVGPGADKLTISSTHNYVVQVIVGVSVSISDLAFKNSQINIEQTGSNFVSFLNNKGTLSLTNSVISGNRTISNHSSTCGGGIYNEGKLILKNTTVANNSTFSHNVARDNSPSICGGGIFNNGPLSLINSSVSNNKASGDTTLLCSGGILNGSSGTLTLTNSTVSGNGAAPGSSDGACSGGIYNQGGILSLINSTISDNTTTSTGGGIFSDGGQISITFCTIYGNTAHEAGGISTTAAQQKGDSLTVRNSIIAGNAALNDPDIAGHIISDGYNLIQNVVGADFVAVPTDRHHTDISGGQLTSLEIDPTLQDNGGQAQPHTWTHRLFAGSPAISHIPPAACKVQNITTDQRGAPRPQGKNCDIGAYEYATTT